MTIWSVEKYIKNLSLEAFHYCLSSENNIWLFEERSSVKTAEYIPYSSKRQFIGDSCLKKKKLKLYCHHLVV